MSLNADTIEFLLSKGLSGADLLEVARRQEVRRDPTAAARMARYRERQKDEDDATRNVTRNDAPLALDKETPPGPPKEINPIPPESETRASGRFQTPDGVTDEQFRAFRQQRKKTLNERSYALLCNKLKALAEDGWPPGEMIDLAIERGWETVFEPKDQANGRQANRGNHRNGVGMGRDQPPDGLSPTRRAALRVFGPPAPGH